MAFQDEGGQGGQVKNSLNYSSIHKITLSIYTRNLNPKALKNPVFNSDHSLGAHVMGQVYNFGGVKLDRISGRANDRIFRMNC